MSSASDSIDVDHGDLLELSDRDLRLLHFRAKLAAEAELMAVVRKVEQGVGEFVLLDVRPAESFAEGHIPGAVSLPLAELADRAETLSRELRYVTYCWRETCQLAAHAALQLTERGFDVRELNAGWREWTAQGFPVEAAIRLSSDKGSK